MTAYIISTLSSGVDYSFYKTAPNGQDIVYKTVSIKGGANVPDKNTLFIPKGVETKITDEEYELLKTHAVFQLHVDKGFIKVIKTSAKDIEKAVETLEKEDTSAPLTPAKMGVEAEEKEDVKVYKKKRGKK